LVARIDLLPIGFALTLHWVHGKCGHGRSLFERIEILKEGQKRHPSRFQVIRVASQKSLFVWSFCHYQGQMRAVIQRVTKADVAISGAVKATIQNGLLVLLAIEDSDTAEDIEWLSGKIVRLRIFNDEQGLMNRSVQEMAGEILLVIQFTLFASTKKGNRPSFSRSARPEVAIPLYEQFIRGLTEGLGRSIQTGEFGADMKVSLTNDGPVTVIIDSKSRE
jgi:D-aminoacyl-tRNA deacylase